MWHVIKRTHAFILKEASLHVCEECVCVFMRVHVCVCVGGGGGVILCMPRAFSCLYVCGLKPEARLICGLFLCVFGLELVFIRTCYQLILIIQ